MQAIVRESIFGQAVNKVSKGKYFPYPEDKPSFQIPNHFLLPHQQQRSENSSRTLTPQNSSSLSTRAPSPVHHKTENPRDSDQQTLNDAHAQAAIERNLKVAKEGLEEGRDPNLVGWYSEDDAENPQ